MSSALLTTKLFMPPLQAGRVTRPRLLQRLDEGRRMGHCLAFVCAPAGYGKTTLIREWLETIKLEEPTMDKQGDLQPTRLQPASVAWLSLDLADNDPIRFWRYMTAALHAAQAGLDLSVQIMLEVPQPPPLDAIVTAVLNAIAEFPGQMLLVLDDYHVIQSASIHASVNFMLDHAPKSLLTVIATREDPPLSLARRRGRRQITEIRAADLRFTPAEASEFLNTVMGLNIPAGDLHDLESHTEGWIVGLQMAAIAMASMPESQEGLAARAAFVTSFTGNDRYIADYLVEEVFQRQPAHLQTFLLVTSILERLNANLCDAILEGGGFGDQESSQLSPYPISPLPAPANSQSMLEQLEQTNLFIVPLDNRREWYRYHHLFGDLLRQRLHQSIGSQAVAGLHKRASLWFASHGFTAEAVAHSLEAGDFVSAAQLIENAAPAMFQRSELVTLAYWIRALPKALLLSRPRLLMIEGWAEVATGQNEEAERCMQWIEQAMGAPMEAILGPQSSDLSQEARNALVEVAVIRIQFAIARIDLARTIELSQRMLPLLSQTDQLCLWNRMADLYPGVVFSLGVAYEIQGELAQAMNAFTEASDKSQVLGNNHLAVLTTGHLGQVQFAQGKLHLAENTFRRVLEISRQMSAVPTPYTSLPLAGLGSIYYEWNELERSLQFYQEAIELAKPWRYWEGMLPGYVCLARLRGAVEDWPAASSVLDEFTELAGGQWQLARPVIELIRAWLDLKKGDLAAASKWVLSAKPDPEGDISYNQLEGVLLYTRFLILQGNPKDAEPILSRAVNLAQSCGAERHLIETHILFARALEAQERSEEALDSLNKALSLAQPEGYLRIFLDEGKSLLSLVEAASLRVKGESPLRSYLNRLLSAFHPPKSSDQKAPLPATKPSASPHLPETLSDRELEVLRLIAEGLTNNEIAQRLYISLTTVKSHTSNIYSKLGVNSRTQAISRARSAGLLPPDAGL